jgi:Domain of unknown function (DUF397)
VSVEVVALADGKVGVRNDTDGPDGPIVVFTSVEWEAHLEAAARGERARWRRPLAASCAR